MHRCIPERSLSIFREEAYRFFLGFAFAFAFGFAFFFAAIFILLSNFLSSRQQNWRSACSVTMYSDCR